VLIPETELVAFWFGQTEVGVEEFFGVGTTGYWGVSAESEEALVSDVDGEFGVRRG
jgi:hypothetical protein